MRTIGRGRKLVGVESSAQANSVQIIVSLERRSRPPCGWIEDSEGHRTTFDGMLELICLLELALADPEPRATDESSWLRG